jgi:hypothetical protein
VGLLRPSLLEDLVVPEVLLPPLVLPDPVPLLLPLVPEGRAALEGLLLLVILFLPLPLVALAVRADLGLPGLLEDPAAQECLDRPWPPELRLARRPPLPLQGLAVLESPGRLLRPEAQAAPDRPLLLEARAALDRPSDPMTVQSRTQAIRLRWREQQWQVISA